MSNCLSVVQTLVLIATAIIVFYYTIETQKLRQVSQETATFAAIATVQERLSSELSTRRRRLLFETWQAFFENCIQQHLALSRPQKRDGEQLLLINTIMTSVKANPEQRRRFRHRFDKDTREGNEKGDGCSGLDIAEGLLEDSDTIALPYARGVKAALDVGKAYWPVLQETAPYLPEFVAVERALSDRLDYKADYVALLVELGIDVPECLKPGWKKPAKKPEA